jgi:hypothetical protein
MWRPGAQGRLPRSLGANATYFDYCRVPRKEAHRSRYFRPALASSLLWTGASWHQTLRPGMPGVYLLAAESCRFCSCLRCCPPPGLLLCKSCSGPLSAAMDRGPQPTGPLNTKPARFTGVQICYSCPACAIWVFVLSSRRVTSPSCLCALHRIPLPSSMLPKERGPPHSGATQRSAVRRTEPGGE